MPVIATQTEPMWDVIDKLNVEFDEVQVKNNKLEEELRGFHLEKHKKNNKNIQTLKDLFRTCEGREEDWEDEYELWGEYPVLNYLREYINGEEEAELDDDLDAYFGRGQHAPHTQQAESRIDELLDQTLAEIDKARRIEAQWHAWNNRRRV